MTVTVILNCILILVVITVYLRCNPPNCVSNRQMSADVFVAAGFEKVRDIFKQHVESGFEKGASFAAYHKGRLVANLWGGVANDFTAEPWNENHMSQFFSSTKGLAAILVAMFVDRGLLDYDAKVAQYWPEFAQNGKENITVRQLVSHQAGLAVVTEKFHIHNVSGDIEMIGRLMERQRPSWTPGAYVGFHMFTYGMLIEYLLYRVDPQRRRINRIYEEEIASPFRVDIHIGLPLHLHHRYTPADFSELGELKTFMGGLARLPSFIRSHLWPTEQDKLNHWAFYNPVDYLPAQPLQSILQPDHLALPMVGTHGFGTARSLAKIWAIVANQGQPLLEDLSCPKEVATNHKWSEYCVAPMFSRKVLDEFKLVQRNTVDYMHHNEPVLMGLGLRMIGRKNDKNETYYLLGHGGHGGQMGYADMEEQVSFAYVTSHMSRKAEGLENGRFRPLYDALYESVKALNDAERDAVARRWLG